VHARNFLVAPRCFSPCRCILSIFRALALEHAAKLHANVTDGANQRSVQLRGRLRRKFQDRSESIPFQNRKTHRARESGLFPCRNRCSRTNLFVKSRSNISVACRKPSNR
jgi:hypothetical protein